MAFFVISDLHFNHDGIIPYENRPFASIEDMNDALILNWNNTVSPDDTVFVLGDFIMGDPQCLEPILKALNGHIILLRGNHDTPAKLAAYNRFPDKIEVHDIYYLSYKGLFFIMCHFPITSPDFLDMVKEDNSEVVVVHGHVHSKAPFAGVEQHIFNVSADAAQFTPIKLDVIWEIVKEDYEIKGVWIGE